jgi:hypothetical protein
MKKSLAVKLSLGLLLAFGCLALAGCSTSSPEDVVSDTLQAYKDNNWDEFANHFAPGTSMASGDVDLDYASFAQAAGVDPELAKRFIETWSSGVEYRIVSSSVEGDQASVTVEMSVLDVVTARSEAAADFMAQAQDDPEVFDDLTQEEFNAALFEAELDALLTAPRTETASFEISLIKEGRSWLINDDNLLFALFSGPAATPMPELVDDIEEGQESDDLIEPEVLDDTQDSDDNE